MTPHPTHPARPARRVLYILGHGAWGGIERHVLALARNLDPARWSASAALLIADGPAADAMRTAGFSVTVLNGGSGRDPRLITRVGNVLNTLKPDIVHSHELHLAPGIAMRLRPRLPWIHTEHCSLSEGPSPAKARLLWRLFAGPMNRVIAVSNATRAQLLQGTPLNPARCITIPNGIDLTDLPRKDPAPLRRELRVPKGAPLFGAVGRLAPQKDWDAFLATASILADQIPDARFVVVGDGPERAHLESAAAQSPLQGRVTFLGSRNDARALIGALDLFLFTSRHEELPTTLLEAFAMRTPVAGFIPDGGVHELLASPGPAPYAAPYAAIDGRNPADLARTAQALLASPGETASMIGAAESLVRSRYSMTEIALHTQGLYDEVAHT